MYRPSLAIQKAIVKALSPLYLIIDYMPDEEHITYPYILIGAELRGETWYKDRSSSHYITLHVWSGEEGQVQVKTIVEDIIYTVLHKHLPIEEGYEITDRSLRLSSTYREIDANREQHHAVVQFDFKIREI